MGESQGHLASSLSRAWAHIGVAPGEELQFNVGEAASTQTGGTHPRGNITGGNPGTNTGFFADSTGGGAGRVSFANQGLIFSEVDEGGASFTADVLIVVPSISSDAPSGNVIFGEAFSYIPTVQGCSEAGIINDGAPTWSISSGELPEGLILNTVTGEISGTATGLVISILL